MMQRFLVPLTSRLEPAAPARPEQLGRAPGCNVGLRRHSFFQAVQSPEYDLHLPILVACLRIRPRAARSASSRSKQSAKN
jgi:hypothetical protein